MLSYRYPCGELLILSLCYVDPPEKLKKTIIYVNDKAGVLNLFELFLGWLGPSGLAPYVQYHHGSATEGKRRDVEDRFKNGPLRIVIATDSLGMGADIRDVFRVIQVKAGDSTAALMQRAGRAARDGVMLGEAIILVEKEIWKGAKYDELVALVSPFLRAVHRCG